MKSFLRLAGPIVQLLFALALLSGSARAQESFFYALYPYDGANLPLDFNKIVYGKSMPEVCGQRTSEEMFAFGPRPSIILYVGWMPSGVHGVCGYQWLNTVNPPPVVSVPVIGAGAKFCPEILSIAAANPGAPVPQSCVMTPCAVGDRLPDGSCPVLSPKNAGKSCPWCGNPVNPATGNKFQEERDLAPVTAGGLSLMRYYNTGRSSPLTKVFGGYWQHNYSKRITTAGTGSTAQYYSSDGKVLTFQLVGGTWIAEADIADVLVEFKDANGVRTAWKYTVAANDDVETYDGSGNPLSILHRGGMTTTFVYSDGTSGSNGGFVLDAAGNPTGVVLQKGLLLKIRDHYGRTLLFGYDSRSRIVKVTDQAGGAIIYAYDVRSNLISVTYADGKTRTYVYNEPSQTTGASLPYHLTGIVDENGDRFATYSYGPGGRATKTTHHANGVEVGRYTLSYDASSAQTTITDPLGTARPNSFQVVVGVVRQTGATQPSASGTGTASNAISYDANGNVSSRTDFNGNRTNYTYDLARNLETSRTEGLTAAGGTTPQTRTISTQWHATFRLPAVTAEPLRISTITYDTAGNRLSRSIQPTGDATGAQGFSATASGAPRTWTYTYNANGSVLTVDGPRTDVADVTTYTYYANNDADLGKRGNVATITNAAGHTTNITAYNAYGQPLTMVDANGLGTTMTYDARQRLKTRTVGSETTTYDYDFAGQLAKVTLPDGSFLSYDYDTAHRLTGMEDNLGNRIAYTLDAMGNRTAEEVRDPANQLAQTRSRVFNNLSRLFRELGAQCQTTEYAYDEQGNVASVKDPLNRVTSNQYDALNRLRQVTSPTPISAVTQYAYDGIDQLVAVTDPRSLVTGYTVDGLGNLNVQASPDTGTTTNAYDDAGNLLSQTDAKSQVTAYTYDALNRVTLITFHDGSKQAYAYDQGSNGIGRLSSITETNPANQVTSVIAYAYDQHGRVTSETRTVGGVQYVLAYAYDGFGRLSGLTYPSGRTVAYGFDGVGRVSQVTTTKSGDQPQTVVSGVTYHPFGGVKGYTLGNGQAYTRGIDLDGRIASYTLGTQSFAIGYDAASRISFISDIGVPANTNTYGYDNLDRITSAVLPATPYAYGYDAVGNRTSKTAGSSTDTYAYSPTSNRIASITPSSGPVKSFVFDANGSTTADGQSTYAYDVRGRMVQATSTIGATSYQVNALGQRIRKTNTLGDTVFHYDTQGKLIAETGPGGALRRELIYLGDIPVGVIQ
jgi:YD repeat-containing protein